MPDWSYHPLFKPILFRMKPEKARDLTFAAMALVGRMRYGPQVIDMMGHMDPPCELSRRVFGRTFSGPVGLGAGLNLQVEAIGALSRFGFGFIELGPVTIAPLNGPEGLVRLPKEHAILFSETPVNGGADALLRRLKATKLPTVDLAIRLTHSPDTTVDAAGVEVAKMIGDFACFAAFFSVDPQSLGKDPKELEGYYKAAVQASEAAENRPALVLCIAPDTELGSAIDHAEAAISAGFSGISVTGGCVSEGKRIVGLTTQSSSLKMVQELRRHFGPDMVIIGSGGILSPQDALDMLDIGATLVQIHSGFVFSGPGLPKRINEAALYEIQAHARASQNEASDLSNGPLGWKLLFLLGLGMMGSGLLALIVAMTRVLLPYDERFVGMTRAQIMALNDCLLHFMAHDRVTLAGTMISIGFLYSFLALNAIRPGAHWAWKAMALSGAFGFSSFFLFLGYGYFDPLHALACAALFPFFILGIRKAPLGVGRINAPSLENDKAWNMSVWGQLIFVALGVGLCLGGISIAIVGVTTVLIPTDLAFLGTTLRDLKHANPRLIPLIAHDRAGFGGALLSDGICVLLSALWGFRRGEKWLWWMLLLSGSSGFLCGLFVHLHIGYTTFSHLLPLYAAIILFGFGLALSKPYLWAKPNESKF